MGIIAILDHLISLLAPALVVGPLLATFAPMTMKQSVFRRDWRGWFRQSLWNALAGCLALAGGLWFFGHDAKMASYCAMIGACATAQFVALRAWRQGLAGRSGR